MAAFEATRRERTQKKLGDIDSTEVDVQLMWSKKAADKKPKPVKEAGFMKNHKSNEKRTEVDIKPNTD